MSWSPAYVFRKLCSPPVAAFSSRAILVTKPMDVCGVGTAKAWRSLPATGVYACCTMLM